MFDLSLQEVTSGKVTAVRELFMAAFIKHHPHIKPSVANGFFDAMPDKSALYEKLVEMYGETVGTLLDEPDEGKAISWKVM